MKLITQLVRRQALPLLLLAGLLMPSISRAGGCGDISALSGRWHGLSKFIDDRNEKKGELSPADVKKVQAEARTLVPITREFAKVVAGIDDKLLHSLGVQMVAILDELSATSDDTDWDDITTTIDKLVDAIDKVAAQCEKG